MMILSVALGLSLLTLTIALIMQLDRRARRKQRREKLELKPNCLLTRYPLVFLAGRRSIFRPFEHFNDIPFFLRQHGYEVYVIDPLPGQELVSILNALEDLKSPCHLIADASSLRLLKELATAKSAKILSLNCVSHGARHEHLARPNADQLKPLPCAIEYFEVADLSSQMRPARMNWREKASMIFLHAHNMLIRDRDRRVDPIETAELIPDGHDRFFIETQFLDLAVSLAERDLRQGGLEVNLS